MAEDQRAEAHAEVDVLAAVDVDESGAIRARVKNSGVAADALERAHRAVHAARRDAAGAVEQRRVPAHAPNPSARRAPRAVGDDVRRARAAEHVPGLEQRRVEIA